MNIKRFNESKKDEEVTGVDIKSFEDDKEVVGFARDTEAISDKEEKKIKKEIQNDGGTPGLKTAIKKFEDFSVKIIIDEEDEDSSVVPVGVDVDQEECCANCDCNPCGCSPEQDVEQNADVESTNVIPFMDFLKNIG
jgi:hypothetical protein